ncbi:tripartite tricarboxylate transporter TctB family protein [Salinibacterium sp. PAMC 21357]|uniref:tripartite tricarboxylate transporter TctB family protein n=1 Tax=Salinibacterium sp. PAMC 21357 TaxID=1112215 RepID=UPI00028929F4|nr:tripartite tricarboxylate transporter TctB family protein [Salinibacterium sp. PAMC 21357]
MTAPVLSEQAPTAGGDESRFRRLVGPLAGPAIGLIFGLAVVVMSQSIVEPNIATSFSPRWWPQSLGALIAILSAGVLIKDIVRPGAPDEMEPATRTGYGRVLAVFGAIAAYAVVWYFVTFPIATALLFVALVLILGARGWKAIVIFPLVCTGVLYTLFGLLLKVPL